jgi:hypothetical protein
MKELIYKFLKKTRTIIVDDAHSAKYCLAIYDTIGHRSNAIERERVWSIGGQEWLLRFRASDSQVDEIRERLNLAL